MAEELEGQMDEITTEDEITDAWKEQIGKIPSSTLKRIRNFLRATGATIIAIPMNLAFRAKEIGKLHVGCTVCHLLRKLTRRRCQSSI